MDKFSGKLVAHDVLRNLFKYSKSMKEYLDFKSKFSLGSCNFRFLICN